MFDIDFESDAPQVICHPQYASKINYLLEMLAPYNLKAHYFLFSSGTTGGDLKGYAISRDALFANARAVNEHFKLTSEDVWALSLPIYHIGGLSVLARAHLLGNKVVDARSWDPDAWSVKMQDVSITTIVPTQLYDLVQRKITPPTALRYLVVGGDFLSSSLKSEAINLGWPVIRTFGMSEVSSQLASSSSPMSDSLEIFPIHEAKISHEGRLLVKSQALFTLEFTLGEKFSVVMAQELCTHDGFYETKDRASISGNLISPNGRIGDEFKVSGHLINLNQLKDQLYTYLMEEDLLNQVELTVEDDARKGKKLVLLGLSNALEKISLEKVSDRILPAKINEVRVVSEFNRTFLGKLKKN